MKTVLIFSFIVLFPILCFSQNISKSKTFKLNGSLSVGGFSYVTNRTNSFLQPYGYSANINITASVYGINIPLHLSFNQQGSSFSTPFNRFGMSPKYKWVTMHLGYRNYNWSEFLIAGATVYGVGLELQLNQYKIGGIIGNLRQTSEGNNSLFNIPQFSRSMQAIRFGSSSKHEYFYVTLLRGKDNITSLPQLSSEITDRLEAQENNAISLSFKSSFIDNKFFIEVESAISAFTENIRNPNIPTDKIPKIKFITKLFDIKPSTHGAYALKGTANYIHKTFKLQLTARKVSPEFKTFGTNYLISDILTYTINPSLNIWNNKISLSSSFGLMYNNLDNRLVNKTNRKIGSLSLNINPSQKFGTLINYSNYSIYQQVIKDSLANDSILIDQINHNFNITPRITLVSTNQIHNIVISANYQTLEDKNKQSKIFSENKILSINGNYSLGLIKSGYNFSLGFNYLTFSSSQLSTNQKGIKLGIRKSFLKKKLSIGLTANYSKLLTNKTKNDLITLLSRINYRVTKKSSLNIQFYLLNKKSTIKPIIETRTQLNYRYNF